MMLWSCASDSSASRRRQSGSVNAVSPRSRRDSINASTVDAAAPSGRGVSICMFMQSARLTKAVSISPARDTMPKAAAMVAWTASWPSSSTRPAATAAACSSSTASCRLMSDEATRAAPASSVSTVIARLPPRAARRHAGRSGAGRPSTERAARVLRRRRAAAAAAAQTPAGDLARGPSLLAPRCSPLGAAAVPSRLRRFAGDSAALTWRQLGHSRLCRSPTALASNLAPVMLKPVEQASFSPVSGSSALQMILVPTLYSACETFVLDQRDHAAQRVGQGEHAGNADALDGRITEQLCDVPVGKAGLLADRLIGGAGRMSPLTQCPLHVGGIADGNDLARVHAAGAPTTGEAKKRMGE